ARRHAELGIAFLYELTAALELVVAPRIARRNPFRLLSSVVGRDLLQVRLGQMREQTFHDRVPPASGAIVLELSVEVAGGLTGDGRKVDHARRAAMLPVAGGARREALAKIAARVRDGIRAGERREDEQGERDEKLRPIQHGLILPWSAAPYYCIFRNAGVIAG